MNRQYRIVFHGTRNDWFMQGVNVEADCLETAVLKARAAFREIHGNRRTARYTIETI